MKRPPHRAWRGLLVAASLAAVSSAGADDKGIEFTHSVANAGLVLNVDGFNGAIESIYFQGEFFQDNDLSWGFQVADDTATTATFAYGGGAFPVTVFVDGNSIVVLGTYEALATVKGVPDVVVDFARVYTLNPDENAFRIETTLVNNSASPVTLRYFDSIDPDYCSVETYTDLSVSLVGGVPIAFATGCDEPLKRKKKKDKSFPDRGPAMVMGTADPRAVLSAGMGDFSSGYYNIIDGNGLNTVHDFPADDNLAFADPAMSAIFDVAIAPGTCERVALDLAIADLESGARQVFVDVGNGSVPPPSVDCTLPTAPPPPPFTTGMYASTYDGFSFRVDLDTALVEPVSLSDCPFEDELKGDGRYGCYNYDSEYDNSTGTMWTVGPTEGPYGYYFGGLVQQYAQQNLATGETLAGAFDFDIQNAPPKAAKGAVVVDSFVFHEVEDIELAGDQWYASVGSWDVLVYDYPPAKGGGVGDYLEWTFDGSVVAPFDPVSGQVSLEAAIADYPGQIVGAMAFDEVNGDLFAVSFFIDSLDKNDGSSTWWQGADKGGPIFESYLSVVDLDGPGGQVGLFPPLPGEGVGLEYDGIGRLFYATYENSAPRGGPSFGDSLYRIDLVSPDRKCKAPGCEFVEPTFVGTMPIDANALMWVVNTEVEEGGCDCPAGGGPTDTVDGRVADDPAGTNRDDFGRSVSVCGDTALIGAPLADPFGAASGTVYVAEYDGSSTWTLLGQLVSGSPAASDSFGFSVSVNGDVAVVGEPYDDTNGLNAGAAHVYRRSLRKGGGTGWFHEATLYGSDAGTSDRFGYSVAICGDRVVVGAPYDIPRPRVGAAYVFEFDSGTRGPSPWSETEKLVPGDGYSGDFFGSTVAIDGDRIAVGSPGDDDLGFSSGSVYVYTLVGTAWIEAKGVAADGAGGDNLGVSVDITGTTIVAGASGEDDGSTNSGAVYLFESLGAGSLANSARGKAVAPWNAAQMGTSVAIAPQALLGKAPIGGGFFVAAGAPFDDQGGIDAGAAHLFAFGGPIKGGPVFELEKYVAVAPDSVDYSGTSVDLTGFTILSGAPYGNRLNSPSVEPGSAYFFTPLH